jgi:hypothetical protein
MAWPAILAAILSSAGSASSGQEKPLDAKGVLGQLMGPSGASQMQQGGAPSTPAPPETYPGLTPSAPPKDPESGFGKFVKGGGIGKTIGLASQLGAFTPQPNPRFQQIPFPMAQSPQLNPFDIIREQQKRPLKNLGMARFELGRRF